LLGDQFACGKYVPHKKYGLYMTKLLEDKYIDPTEEIHSVLEKHKIWLESKGVHGAKANFEKLDLRIGVQQDISSPSNEDHEHMIDLGVHTLSFKQTSGVDLSGMDLRKVNFQGANLSLANLSGARLQGANLYGTILDNANLQKASLCYTNLERASLVNSDLTGSVLYKATYDFWNIHGIKCDFICFDWNTSQRTPPDRDFSLGEFERVYNWYPSFLYHFKDKMQALDPYIITLLVSALNDGIDKVALHLDQITGKGLTPIVEFSIRGTANITDIERIIKTTLDNHLDEMRSTLNEISISQSSLPSAINFSILNTMKEINMTKLEFKGPVQNVIADNHGTIKIQNMSQTQLSSIIKEIDQISEKNTSDSEYKLALKKELGKITAGEIKNLSQQSIKWLSERAGIISEKLLNIISASNL
jgi:uncharacterized protein YjbI with pentapeptide repeats